MGKKPNPLLAAYEAQLERKYRQNLNIAMQLAEIEGDRAKDWDARMAWTWIGGK